MAQAILHQLLAEAGEVNEADLDLQRLPVMLLARAYDRMAKGDTAQEILRDLREAHKAHAHTGPLGPTGDPKFEKQKSSTTSAHPAPQPKVATQAASNEKPKNTAPAATTKPPLEPLLGEITSLVKERRALMRVLRFHKDCASWARSGRVAGKAPRLSKLDTRAEDAAVASCVATDLKELISRPDGAAEAAMPTRRAAVLAIHERQLTELLKLYESAQQIPDEPVDRVKHRLLDEVGRHLFSTDSGMIDDDDEKLDTVLDDLAEAGLEEFAEDLHLRAARQVEEGVSMPFQYAPPSAQAGIPVTEDEEAALREFEEQERLREEQERIRLEEEEWLAELEAEEGRRELAAGAELPPTPPLVASPPPSPPPELEKPLTAEEEDDFEAAWQAELRKQEESCSPTNRASVGRSVGAPASPVAPASPLSLVSASPLTLARTPGSPNRTWRIASEEEATRRRLQTPDKPVSVVSLPDFVAANKSPSQTPQTPSRTRRPAQEQEPLQVPSSIQPRRPFDDPLAADIERLILQQHQAMAHLSSDTSSPRPNKSQTGKDRPVLQPIQAKPLPTSPSLVFEHPLQFQASPSNTQPNPPSVSNSTVQNPSSPDAAAPFPNGTRGKAGESAIRLSGQQLPNPGFLRAYFAVHKYDPHRQILARKKRVWLVDQFNKILSYCDAKKQPKREHPASHLMLLERPSVDPRRLRLVFAGTTAPYELLFKSVEERTCFFELAAAARSSVAPVWCPELCPMATADCTLLEIVCESLRVPVVDTAPHSSSKPEFMEFTGVAKVNVAADATEQIAVWTGTWNLSGRPFSMDCLGEWVPSHYYDIYAVSVQEMQQTDDSDWVAMLCAILDSDCTPVATMALQDLGLCVLAKKRLLARISNVEGSSKATSRTSTVGGRGGVSVGLQLDDTPLCFVNCQLTPRVEMSDRRNAELAEIFDGLRMAQHQLEVTHQYHHVFLMGDLSYRVVLEYDRAARLAANGEFEELLRHDQLRHEQQRNACLRGFTEGDVTFKPTYRYKLKSAAYTDEKQTVPSYCDRILVKSFPGKSVRHTGYGASIGTTVSEHAFVFATFLVHVQRPFLATFAPPEPSPLILFDEFELRGDFLARLDRVQLLLFTTFSDAPHASKPLRAKASSGPVVWFEKDMPVVKPAVSQLHFLRRQHIAFAVRDATQRNEKGAPLVYGAGVVPMRDCCSSTPSVVHVPLESRGVLCGELVGSIRLVVV